MITFLFPTRKMDMENLDDLCALRPQRSGVSQEQPAIQLSAACCCAAPLHYDWRKLGISALAGSLTRCSRKQSLRVGSRISRARESLSVPGSMLRNSVWICSVDIQTDGSRRRERRYAAAHDDEDGRAGERSARLGCRQARIVHADRSVPGKPRRGTQPST